MRDLDLLVEAALALLRLALAGDHDLAAADLDAHVVQVDAGEVRLHDRARRLAAVVDVDVRREGAPRREPGALEHVAEELVDVAAHSLEVGEEIALRGHRRLAYRALRPGKRRLLGPARRARRRRRRPRAWPTASRARRRCA